MSFYGDIKRIPASPWVFDKIYANRLEMNNQADSDNIHIGRYVLVNYRIDPDTRALIDKWEPDNNVPNGLKLSTIYSDNQQADIERWGDSFDLTVWQKVFSAGVDKYILVAELRAGIPHLDLDSKAPIELIGENETWTVPTFVPLNTTYSTKNTNDVYATEGMYRYEFPRPLALFVDSTGNAILGGDAFIDPRYHYETIPGNEEATLTNNVAWTLGHIDSNNQFAVGGIKDSNNQETPFYDAKSLSMQLYGVGAAIRQLYDILFGLPAEGADPPIRQGYPIDELFNNEDLYNIYQQKGLYGLLQALNIVQAAAQTNDPGGEHWSNEAQYIYFITRWGDASENSDSFIQNIPQVVTSSDQSSKGHYYIDLKDENQNYLQS